MIDVDLVGELQIICLATPPSRKWGISPLFKLTFLQRVQYGKGDTTVEKRDKHSLVPGDQGQYQQR